MSARYKCPACGIQLTLNAAPEPRFECPKCKRVVTLNSLESTPAPSAPKPPPNRPARAVAAADAFDLPRKSPLPAKNPPAQRDATGEEPFLRTPWDNSRFRVRAIVGGLVVLLSIILIAVFALRKAPTAPELARSKPSEGTLDPPPIPDRPPEPSPQRPHPSPIARPDSKEPEPPIATAPTPKPPLVYDQYGNLAGNDIGLAKQHEFKGQKLLFWGGHTAFPKVFFSLSNPLWKAFDDKGFSVRREFGSFKIEWLNEIDQLWILSSSTMAILPGEVTPALVEESLKLDLARNPPNKRQFGWSDKNFLLSARAEMELALSPQFPLYEVAFKAVDNFIRRGKGVCLLSGNEPYTHEANELATRLYGVSTSGNYPGQKIAYIRQRGLSADTIHKFGGAYAVDDNPLLTGINFIQEGISIGNVEVSDKLEVAMKGSDGKPLLAISRVPGQRVVIDCGFTRYCHGVNEETSFILKSAGTLRLAQNIAAYLAGKDEVKKP